MEHGFKLHPDGTLEITLPQGTKVGRVLVCEAGTQNGSFYYPESDVPDATDCTDCIKHGGDWECDRTHCRKGTKQQATKASDCVNRRDAIKFLANALWSTPNELYTSFNCYENCEKVVKEAFQWLPSAEPEIVTCKECKHRGEEPIADGRYWCEVHNTFMYYCSDAERRTDE